MSELTLRLNITGIWYIVVALTPIINRVLITRCTMRHINYYEFQNLHNSVHNNQ